MNKINYRLTGTDHNLFLLTGRASAIFTRQTILSKPLNEVAGSIIKVKQRI
jgi:hypothetical protein